MKKMSWFEFFGKWMTAWSICILSTCGILAEVSSPSWASVEELPFTMPSAGKPKASMEIKPETSPEMRIAQVSPDSSIPVKKTSGWYMGMSGGLQSRERAGESDSTFVLFRGGYILGSMIGYRFSPQTRLELEYNYFNNDTQTVAPPPSIGLGSVSGNAYMLNFYYDFPIDGSQFSPYLGVGAGFLNTSVKNLSNVVLSTVPPPNGPIFVNGISENAFAFQVRLGTSYTLSTNWELFAGYHYFNSNTLVFNNTVFGTLRPDGAKLHIFEFGTRYSF